MKAYIRIASKLFIIAILKQNFVMSSSQNTQHVSTTSKNILNGNRQTSTSQLTYSIPPTLPKLPQNVPIVQTPPADSSVYIRAQILQFTSIAQNQRITIPPPFLQSYKYPIHTASPQGYKPANKIVFKQKEKRDKQVEKPAVRGVAPQQSRLRDSNSVSNLGNSLVSMLDILAKNQRKLTELSNANLLILQQMSSVLKEFLKAL